MSHGLEAYRTRVSESKRKSILSAARSVFLLNGFQDAAMAGIARKADVSTATLYKHFKSKERLFDAVANAEETRGGQVAVNAFIGRMAVFSIKSIAYNSKATHKAVGVLDGFVSSMEKASKDAA
ncbi:TetR/AcrR family transcriptional regulator [Parvibaculaceae bacterium PLY_AMNH_Bact1]|nr:TetR/AcrR family transcriptional regulator [Parvibaculaceae bacterium PLY_AMNH_Bact1]